MYIRFGMAALLCFFATPILAQGAIYQPPGLDPTTVNAAIANAQAAANSAQASIPPICLTAPAGDTLNGTVGSSPACTPSANNTRPTAVKAGNTTLAANCTFTVVFARSFTSSTPFVYAAVVDSSGGQMPCKAQTRSATGFTGVCNAAQSSVLSLATVTAGVTVLPFGSTCAAGTPVMFVGREPTQ